MDKETFSFGYSNNFGGESYHHTFDSSTMTAMELYAKFLEWARVVYGWNVEEHIKDLYAVD